MAELRTVRTTMRPWEELHVDEAEYNDLYAQGLLLGGGGQHQVAQAVVDETVTPLAGEATPPTSATTKRGQK